MKKSGILGFLGAMMGMTAQANTAPTQGKDATPVGAEMNRPVVFNFSRGMFIPSKSMQVKGKQLRRANKQSGRV